MAQKESFIKIDLTDMYGYPKDWQELITETLRTMRETLAKEIESITLEPSIDNAVGMQMMAAKIVRGKNEIRN